MTQATEPNAPPQFDLADRMRKTLRSEETGIGEMAEYLGVRRETVSAWINGRARPSVATLKLWALKCGVSYDWLVNG